MTDTPDTPIEAKPVEIDGWLISELVRQYNESIHLRQDLAQLLGVEFLMPAPPTIPERIFSATAADTVRSVLPAVFEHMRATGTNTIELAAEIAGQVAAKVAYSAPGTATTTAVRRVERDEHGRIARIIDEAVTS